MTDKNEEESVESLAKKIKRYRQEGRIDEALALEPDVKALPDPEITPFELHLKPDVKVRALSGLAFIYSRRRDRGDEKKL